MNDIDPTAPFALTAVPCSNDGLPPGWGPWQLPSGWQFLG